jgi:hypothetical protein
MGCADETSIINNINAIKTELGSSINNVTNQAQYATKQIKLNQYQSYIQQLEGLIKDNCFLSNPSTDISTIEDTIAKLVEQIEEKEHDIDVAKSRREAIIESKKTASYYQGFSAKLGFTKPIKKTSVPILIALGILLTIMALYMGKVLFFSESPITTTMDSGVFDKKAFLAGVGLVAIIVAILSFLGVYGRSPN